VQKCYVQLEQFTIDPARLLLDPNNYRFHDLSVILEQHPELQQLSASEKLDLVSELWDNLAATSRGVPVAPGQIAEVDRRMEAYRKDPTQVTTWETIRGQILGSDANAGRASLYSYSPQISTFSTHMTSTRRS
jgi:putative addiction module component (TIGR02574 family)